MGNLVPPRGARGSSTLQETAFSKTETFEELKAKARTQLRDRLCQGILCSMIEQNITTWKTSEGGGYRCVMVVIGKSHLDEWKQLVETQLGERLKDRALAVVGKLRDQLDGKKPRITIAKISDHGVPGGPRSEWLHRHMQYALEHASATVVPLQPDWSGRGLPNKVDGVVDAQITPMGGVEKSLEVLWNVKTADQILSAQGLKFPSAIAPDVDESTYLPPLNVSSDKVAIHFDAREGGGLCHGQKTELWLETAEDMHVRVLNLYGKTGGTVIFPIQEGDDDVVKAGEPVSLGEFEAMKVGDIGVERFLVIASPTKKGLGKYASADKFCRLPFTMAKELQYGQKLPEGKNTHLTETGFRLMSGEECKLFQVDENKVSAMRQALKGAPKCW